MVKFLKEVSADGLFSGFPPKPNIFVNHYSLYRLLKANFEFENCHILIDGSLLVWQLKLHGIDARRQSFDFSSIAHDFFEHCTSNDNRSLFIGATTDQSRRFKEIINRLYPKLSIACLDGYEQWELWESHIAEADHIVFGVGTPLQEILAKGYSEKYQSKKFWTCGGFIAQTAMSRSGEFYPPGFDKPFMRALYRFYVQPYTLRRVIDTYPRSLVLTERLLS